MKKVYIPTTDELYIMQDKGMNIYKYLIVKAIESIIMDVKLNGGNDTSILKSIYKYLRENPYIYYAICRLYPEEIKHSEMAPHDTSLCLELISPTYNQDRTIYNLDNLSYFENGIGIYSNTMVIERTVKTLIEKLPLTPNYRFEYKPSKLLDDIFSCDLETMFLSIPMTELAKIEPAYLLKQPEVSLPYGQVDLIQNARNNGYINQYASRYGIAPYECDEYRNKDILTNPDTEVKRLLKCIKQRNKR